MNRHQRRAYYELVDRAREHWCREIYSPVSVTLICQCGWSHTVSRRQNALARASKLRAAELRHLREKAKP